LSHWETRGFLDTFQNGWIGQLIGWDVEALEDGVDVDVLEVTDDVGVDSIDVIFVFLDLLAALEHEFEHVKVECGVETTVENLRIRFVKCAILF